MVFLVCFIEHVEEMPSQTHHQAIHFTARIRYRMDRTAATKILMGHEENIQLGDIETRVCLPHTLYSIMNFEANSSETTRAHMPNKFVRIKLWRSPYSKSILFETEIYEFRSNCSFITTERRTAKCDGKRQS